MATDSSERFVLLNRLAEEFAARYRRGELPSLQEYIDRHPELAEDIRNFLPAMVGREQAKEDRQEVSEPAAGPLPPLERLGDYRIIRQLDDQPVKARRISSVERLARWARRNKQVAAALGVIGFLLVAAAIISSVAAVRFQRLARDEENARLATDDARDEAERQRKSERWQRDRSNIAAPGSALQFQSNGAARRADAYVPPRGYVCYRAAGPITLDGKLDETAWQAVPWTEDFVDIEGGLRMPPRYRTRVKMLWDNRNLYIGAALEEPHVQGTYTKRDSYIFHEDNDFEVFINPDGNNHHYAELEMNALNTVWDLRLQKPYRDGGQAEDAWDIPGLKTAVHVNGTINNPQDLDKGWTIEIAIPWEIVRALNNQPGSAPRDGDQWRINFSRVEWRFDIVKGKYVRRKDRPEDNWVWSPQGVVNMHQPETWGYVQFSTAAPGTAAFRPDPAGPAKHLLHRIYYAQKAFKKEHDRYARTLAELNLADVHEATLAGPPLLKAEADRFRATVDAKLAAGRRQRWHIREDSRVWSAR